MPDRVKQIWERIGGFFKNMKKGMRIGLITGVAVIIALIAALTIHKATRPYAILFSGLTTEDLQTVTSYLSTAGVSDVRIRGDDTIMVRETEVDRLRALVIQQGYPSSGYAYGTYFDHISALSSQADRQQLVLFQLQERLASTIRWFDGVKDAHVDITPGEDHRYILDESSMEAKASVTVRMDAGKTLTSNQVAAIQRLVANAEQGLTISNVTVEDGAGNRYTSVSGTAAALDDTMKYKLALEAKVNEDRRNNIMNVLSPIFGPGNVEVSVNSTVDVTHSYSELLQYFEPDWAADGSTEGRGIIGSQVWDNGLVRAGDTTAGGVTGEPNNSELNTYVTNEDNVRGDETEIYRSGEIYYDVSHETTQTERPAGTITDITVAIAINSAKMPLQDPGNFVHMAAMAAGISASVEAEKVAIVYYPFYQENAGDTPLVPVTTLFGLPAWAVYAAIAGFALFLAMLLIILLLRSKKKKKIAILLAQQEEAAAAEAAAEAAAAAALLEQEGADIMEVHTEETMRMRQDVRQFVEENPAIAAQMIKNWLRGGEEQA